MSSRLRILVIDDDPMFRNILLSHLRKDYFVSVAPDGKDGFDKAQQHRPDFVIVDYQMPGWNGVETLKAFRSDARFNSLKMIMLTSDASKETVLSAIRAGADSYVIKTAFDKDDFLTKIRGILSPSSSVASSVQEPEPESAAVEPEEPNPQYSAEEQELEKEMREFQASLPVNEELVKAATPEQGLLSEDELVKDAMIEWE